MKDAAKLIEYSQGDRLIHLFQVLSNFPSQPNSNLHAIISRLVQQQQQYLRNNHLMSNLLINKMRNKRSGRQADSLIIPLICLLKLHNKPVQQQLPNLRKLRINNSSHSSINRRERQTRSLRLHDTPAK
jgi:hypothetical protein